MPTAIAPTFDLAEPRVGRRVEKWVERLGARLISLEACDPETISVESRDGKARWIEGVWMALIEADSYSDYHLPWESDQTYSVMGVEVRPRSETKVLIILGISARIMR